MTVPGAMTPAEILSTWEAEADLVKVLPAHQLGGPSYTKSTKAPLLQILLSPTGGASLDSEG